MFRIIAMAFTGAFVFMNTLAHGADMARKAPGTESYAAVSNFAGFYIGPSIGYGWAKTEADAGGGVEVKPDGFLGGGQAGVNFQHGQVVVGIEGDVFWTNLKGKLTGAGCGGGCAGISGTYDMLATVRGRLGLTAFGPNTLIYATAGMAFGRSALEVPGTELTTNHIGWTAGAGVDVLLAPHWVAGMKVLYIDFGNATVAGVLPTKDNQLWVTTLSLSFKF